MVIAGHRNRSFFYFWFRWSLPLLSAAERDQYVGGGAKKNEAPPILSSACRWPESITGPSSRAKSRDKCWLRSFPIEFLIEKWNFPIKIIKKEELIRWKWSNIELEKIDGNLCLVSARLSHNRHYRFPYYFPSSFRAVSEQISWIYTNSMIIVIIININSMIELIFI